MFPRQTSQIGLSETQQTGPHKQLSYKNKQVLRHRVGCLETKPHDRSKQIWVNLVDGRFQTLFVFPRLPPRPPSAGNAGRKLPPELEPQPAPTTSQRTGPSCRTSDHSRTTAGDGSEANDGNLVQDKQDCSGLEREEGQLEFVKTIILDDIITISAPSTSAFVALKVFGGARGDHGTCR